MGVQSVNEFLAKLFQRLLLLRDRDTRLIEPEASDGCYNYSYVLFASPLVFRCQLADQRSGSSAAAEQPKCQNENKHDNSLRQLFLEGIGAAPERQRQNLMHGQQLSILSGLGGE